MDVTDDGKSIVLEMEGMLKRKGHMTLDDRGGKGRHSHLLYPIIFGPVNVFSFFLFSVFCSGDFDEGRRREEGGRREARSER